MNILVHFPFTEDQMRGLREVAGDASVVQVASDAEALERMPAAQIVMGECSAEMFAARGDLRWIQAYGAGLDRYPLEAIAKTGVQLTNMAGVYADQCAEHAWSLLLALTRGIPHFVRRQDQARWTTFGPFQQSLDVEGSPLLDLAGSTLGIIGLGGIGMGMARRAVGYDMTIIALDPARRERPDCVAELRPPTTENLHDLLRRADAVMIACPATSETRHLIGEAELARMKLSAYLVNVSRGGIIDERALIEALRARRIAGAGLDVFEREPLDARSPLWSLPNALVTTHVAGASQNRPRRTAEFFRENLRRYLGGEELLNRVDARRGF